MKNFKKVLALVLAVAMLMSFATIASAENKTSEVYGDAADINYVEAVDVLTAIGVIDGISGDFKPADTLTRAQAAKIIAMFDNGDTEINKLYAAANPFTDVAKGSWAESFIAYCYKMGIVGGIGNNLFAPNAEVTGIQYLKMVLCVLGYDAKEEGLEGTSWKVNTLALAKDAGLLEVLGRRYDYDAPISREAAVQVMLNALLADCVEYGYGLKRNEDYLTIAGAIPVEADADEDSAAGYYEDGILQLFEAWELECDYDVDAYGRPARVWEYDRDPIGFGYTAVADYIYTEAVRGCDVYDDTGLEETEDADYILNVHDVVAADTDSDALDFVLVDSARDEDMIGATGVRTEIYVDEDDAGNETVDVFFIHTYLAEVVSVKNAKIDSKGHELAPAEVKLQVYVNADTDDSVNAANETITVWAEAEGFSKEDMVLVTFDAETGEEVITIMDAEDDVASFDRRGRDGATLTLGGEVTPIAYDLNKGLEIIADPEEYVGSDLVVYYDEYGNVIGLDLYDEAGSYAVISAMWVEYVRGDAVLKADLVFANGDEMEEVVVEELEIDDLVLDYDFIRYSEIADIEVNDANEFDGESLLGDILYQEVGVYDGVYDILYSYDVDEDDVYTLEAVPATAMDLAIEFKTAQSRVKVDGDYYKLNDETAFIVEEEAAPRGEYDVFAGNDGLTACNADVRVYDFDEDGIADIAFLSGVINNGSRAIAWYNGGEFEFIENLKDEDGDHFIYEVELAVLSEDGTTFEVDTYQIDNGDEMLRDENTFTDALIGNNVDGLFNCFIDEDGYVVVDELEPEEINFSEITAADEDGEFVEIYVDGEEYEVELDEVEVWAVIDDDVELVECDYDLYEGYEVAYVLDDEGEVTVMVVVLNHVAFECDGAECEDVTFEHDDVFVGRYVEDEVFTLDGAKDTDTFSIGDFDGEALTITGYLPDVIEVTHA